MVVVKWKNAACTDAGLQLISECARKVEDKINKHREDAKAVKSESAAPPTTDDLPFHVPTALNDELHSQCIAVAVSHNSGRFTTHRLSHV
jgi:hypothetical protein